MEEDPQLAVILWEDPGAPSLLKTTEKKKYDEWWELHFDFQTRSKSSSALNH